MNRMQTLIKAAVLTGFISLVGVSYIVFSVVSSPAPVTVPVHARQPQAEEKVQVKEQAPSVDANLPSTTPLPSKITMRRTAYALPGYSVVKQVTMAFPTIKRQVQRKLEEQRQRELEEQRQLEEQEKAFFNMEVEPPVATPQPSARQQAPQEEKVPEAQVVKKEEPVRQPAKALSAEAEKAILAEAARTSAERNRKQEVLETGKLPVRDMKKRFDGTLTEQQLANVLNDIFGEKGEQDSDATCVQIRSLPETEVTARQLTSYLLKNGFTMAGRGEATNKDRGIKVDASGKCIVVTIGKIS
ncbi:hypothetical protein [Aridibaculum aurantiacum]|uniref:hypothetical protein n=1 Tax=Aridibaculum aurantiacum TaxID=2810307 RepID=UPI001A956942|nr:hypothetical protein [Aridibaculum aurantiacum]